MRGRSRQPKSGALKPGSGLFRLETAVAALELRLFPTLQRWAEEPHLKAIRDVIGPAFGVLLAVTIVAYFLVPPQPVSARFFVAYFIGFGGMGVALAILLSDRLARTFGYSRPVGVAASFTAFVASLPRPIPANLIEELGRISTTSLFVAMVICLVTAEFFRLAGRRLGNGPLALIAGTLATGVLFGGLAAVLIPHHLSLVDLLFKPVKALVGIGDTLPALLVVVILQTLLWSAGVHGPAFLAAVTTPIFVAALAANAQAVKLHETPPHVVTWMIYTFVYPGGSGATLPLGLLLLRSRIARLRRLGLASLLPSLMNVNEPLIFGVPLVMNPSLAIPFIGVPLVLATITYVAMYFGFVDRTIYYIPTVVPAPISAFLSTGDWRALALMGVNMALGFVLYLPFLRSFEAGIAAAPAAEEALVKTAEAVREHKLELEPHPAPTSDPSQ